MLVVGDNSPAVDAVVCISVWNAGPNLADSVGHPLVHCFAALFCAWMSFECWVSPSFILSIWSLAPVVAPVHKLCHFFWLHPATTSHFPQFIFMGVFVTWLPGQDTLLPFGSWGTSWCPIVWQVGEAPESMGYWFFLTIITTGNVVRILFFHYPQSWAF